MATSSRTPLSSASGMGDQVGDGYSVVRYAHSRKAGLESLRDFALPPSMIHEGLVFTWLVYPPLETPLYLPFSSEPTEKRHLLAYHDEVWYTPEDMQIACGFSQDTIELIRGDGAYYATRGLSERARRAVYRHFKRKDYPNSYLNVTKKTWTAESFCQFVLERCQGETTILHQWEGDMLWYNFRGAWREWALTMPSPPQQSTLRKALTDLSYTRLARRVRLNGKVVYLNGIRRGGGGVLPAK